MIRPYAAAAAALALLLPTACATAPAGDSAVAQQLADRAAVEAVLARYMYTLDRLEPEAYADVFTPDGELVVYGEEVHAGREGLIAYLAGVKANQDAAAARGELQQFFHLHYNQRIEMVDADTAYHHAFWTTTARMPDGSVEDLAVGTLKDEFVKVGGEWFLLRRELFRDP